MIYEDPADVSDCECCNKEVHYNLLKHFAEQSLCPECYAAEKADYGMMRYKEMREDKLIDG